jgi:hypothetical protein
LWNWIKLSNLRAHITHKHTQIVTICIVISLLVHYKNSRAIPRGK